MKIGGCLCILVAKQIQIILIYWLFLFFLFITFFQSHFNLEKVGVSRAQNCIEMPRLPTLKKQCQKADGSMLGKRVWFVMSCRNNVLSLLSTAWRYKQVRTDEKNTTLELFCFSNKLSHSMLYFMVASAQTAQIIRDGLGKIIV